jgi:hypothetical protein
LEVLEFELVLTSTKFEPLKFLKANKLSADNDRDEEEEIFERSLANADRVIVIIDVLIHLDEDKIEHNNWIRNEIDIGIKCLLTDDEYIELFGDDSGL